MKSTKRRRVDVNLDELDRVLDGARQAPLSEADCDKLKSALHALAAMLAPSRHTEKTTAVLEEPENPKTGDGAEPDTGVSPQPGHGRNGAEAFGSARKVDIAHQKLTHGDRCPECGKGNVYAQKEPKVLVRIVGQACQWRRKSEPFWRVKGDQRVGYGLALRTPDESAGTARLVTWTPSLRLRLPRLVELTRRGKTCP